MRKKSKDKRQRSQRPPHFHIEADRYSGGISVIISGVKEIIDFSDTQVILSLVGGKISIKGTLLTLTLFENGTLQIFGKIALWEFLYGKA